MAQGLPLLDANVADLQNDIPEDKEDWEAELPPNFVLIGALGTDSETFSSAVKMPTVWVILANVATQDWEIEHVNVKSAYLNTTLKEMIYMKPPQGVLKPGEEGKVCCLVKGLYGLKQAGRGWYQEMSR